MIDRLLFRRRARAEVNTENRDPSPQQIASDDVLDLRAIFVVWLRWSWVLIILGAVGAYKGVQDARNFSPTYTASMVVMPDSGSVSISQAAAGIGSALGVNLAGPQSSTFGRLRVVIGSITLAENLARKHQLLQRVYQGGWDEASGSWRRPTGEKFERSERTRRYFGLSEWSPPSVHTLASYLGGSIRTELMPDSSFFKVTFRHGDPEFALELLTLVYEEADQLLRQQDLVESRLRRDYLERQLRSERLLDSRQALTGLLVSEERKAMFLETDLPYTARIIDPPYVTAKPDEPNLRLTIGFPAVIAVIIGLTAITAITLFRRV